MSVRTMRTCLSQFTIEEQQRGLTLESELSSHNKRMEEWQKRQRAAVERLSAAPFFDEMRQQPGLDEKQVAAVTQIQERYLSRQKAEKEEADTELAKLHVDWLFLQPALLSNREVLTAIRGYRELYCREPVIYEDMPVAWQLGNGSYLDFRNKLRRELEETRQMLTRTSPLFPESHLFCTAERYILMDTTGTGMLLCQAADRLRAARDMLAQLRKEASSAAADSSLQQH